MASLSVGTLRRVPHTEVFTFIFPPVSHFRLKSCYHHNHNIVPHNLILNHNDIESLERSHRFVDRLVGVRLEKGPKGEGQEGVSIDNAYGKGFSTSPQFI